MQKEKNLILVIIFVVAMAYLESAVVVYLRGLYGIKDLLRDMNFKPDMYTFVELGREAATIVMLIIIGLMAGNTAWKKAGYFFIAFGVWDIFYYIWLFVFIQWPKSLFEWDILFLIPLPWWGPVLAPVLISLLLIVTGYFLIKEKQFRIRKVDWIFIIFSMMIILFTFMEDSISIIISGTGDLTTVRPTCFNWIIFLTAYFIWLITTFRVFNPSKAK